MEEEMLFVEKDLRFPADRELVTVDGEVVSLGGDLLFDNDVSSVKNFGFLVMMRSVGVMFDVMEVRCRRWEMTVGFVGDGDDGSGVLDFSMLDGVMMLVMVLVLVPMLDVVMMLVMVVVMDGHNGCFVFDGDGSGMRGSCVQVLNWLVVVVVENGFRVLEVNALWRQQNVVGAEIEHTHH